MFVFAKGAPVLPEPEGDNVGDRGVAGGNFFGLRICTLASFGIPVAPLPPRTSSLTGFSARDGGVNDTPQSRSKRSRTARKLGVFKVPPDELFTDVSFETALRVCCGLTTLGAGLGREGLPMGVPIVAAGDICVEEIEC